MERKYIIRCDAKFFLNTFQFLGMVQYLLQKNCTIRSLRLFIKKCFLQSVFLVLKILEFLCYKHRRSHDFSDSYYFSRFVLHFFIYFNYLVFLGVLCFLCVWFFVVCFCFWFVFIVFALFVCFTLLSLSKYQRYSFVKMNSDTQWCFENLTYFAFEYFWQLYFCMAKLPSL